jgi:hypothetical protein
MAAHTGKTQQNEKSEGQRSEDPVNGSEEDKVKILSTTKRESHV